MKQGNVTGISAGTAVITVTADNASASGAPLTAQIIITVNDTQTDASTSALTIK